MNSTAVVNLLLVVQQRVTLLHRGHPPYDDGGTGTLLTECGLIIVCVCVCVCVSIVIGEKALIKDYSLVLDIVMEWNPYRDRNPRTLIEEVLLEYLGNRDYTLHYS